MPITMLDGLLLCIILISGLLAMLRGFSREILSVISWAVSSFVGLKFYKPATPLFKGYISSDMLAQLVSGGTLFLITLVILTIITVKVADSIIDSSIGALDRSLGFAFGAVRGVLLMVVGMLFFTSLVQKNQPDWIAKAKSKPILDQLGKTLVSVLPEDLVSKLQKEDKESSEITGTADSALKDVNKALPKADIQ
jgi:membrane protein required for colicin V production